MTDPLDPVYMHRCIELARLGMGRAAPNPMVGSVLVYNGRIVGEGFHEQYGQAHAEVNCIRQAENRLASEGLTPDAIGDILKESTIYVSLEPCAHFGKTPPCADLIISKSIARVVVGCRDPFPLVDGKGIEKIRAAHIPVTEGVLENECRSLNERFFTFHSGQRPYIILKWAESADRKIAGAPPDRTFISNEISNRLVHKWRSEEAAIMVGTNTALADNPSLTTRLWPGRNPVRVVLDMHLRLPASLSVFNDEAQTIIFNGQEENERGHVKRCRVDSSLPLLPQVYQRLYQLNIQSVLVEGGHHLLQTFIDEGLWDEARVITNEWLLLEAGTPSPDLANCRLLETINLRNDRLRIYRNNRIYGH